MIDGPGILIKDAVNHPYLIIGIIFFINHAPDGLGKIANRSLVVFGGIITVGQSYQGIAIGTAGGIYIGHIVFKVGQGPGVGTRIVVGITTAINRPPIVFRIGRPANFNGGLVIRQGGLVLAPDGVGFTDI